MSSNELKLDYRFIKVYWNEAIDLLKYTGMRL